MIDTVRLSELRNEVGKDDLAEVVLLFCEEFEEALQRIDPEVVGPLMEELHFLKGSALNIGLADVGNLCGTVERKVRQGGCVVSDIAHIGEAFRSSRQMLLAEIGVS